MVHQLNCASDAELFFVGVVFVNDNVIVTLKGTPFDESETATQPVELREINACQSVKAAKRLNHGACSKCDMWLFHEEWEQILIQRRRTKADHGGSRRTDHNVRPYAASTTSRLVQRPVTDANQRQDHGDLDTYGKHA